jgi:iron only hydrogenase large subunit-like protein/uncharacterized Fe-S cluster-containing protein
MKSASDLIQVVYTNKAKCRDCYRCVRVCPVCAIKIKDGQANVIPERCISCGTCVTECPQKAKSYQSATDIVLQFIEKKETIVASIAPSFAAVFSVDEQSRIASALRKIGFSWVAETAIGASYVANQSANYINENPNKTHICTACPAIVNYIEIYHHSFVQNLIPVASPMIAHAKLLKEKHGKNAKVVFIGPCIAKIDEALHPANKGLVDAVLTFSELREILLKKRINISDCKVGFFDEFPDADARLFPIEGGLLKTAKSETDILSDKKISISGFSHFDDAITTLSENKSLNFTIEPLFCEYGCINGPDIRKNKHQFLSRNQIIGYNRIMADKTSIANKKLNILTNFNNRVNPQHEYTEVQINEVLLKTGKNNPEDQLNCGACGYDNCRRKAIAVLEGLAEPEMCIPYMRRLAESKNDLILKTDPNGIVVLNQDLEILQVNPAFQKMFSCTEKILGNKISYLLDPEPFEKFVSGKEKELHQKVKFPNYNLICHQIIYSIENEKQIVGIFVNITDFEINEVKLKNIKTDTIIQAEELIEHQIKMAQDLVRFLGENTAKGEALLTKLIKAIEK